MNILGISAFYHDAAAALVRDGKLVAAAQEERFSRVRHDEKLPLNAIEYCLREAGIEMSEIDYVVFYDKPFLKIERLLSTYLHAFPRGFRSFMSAIPQWMSRKLWMKNIIREELKFKGPITFCEHHYSHAASAFLVSPFEEAAVLSVDGVGEWATSSWGVGRGSSLSLTHETRFPHSLGLLYSAFTYYLGFKVNSGEYKVMGLAPYGAPTFYDQVRKVIDWKSDGSFHLDLQYFDFVGGQRMTNKKFDELFGGPPRKSETRMAQRDFDIAASVQKVTDEIMVAMASHIRKETGLSNLCMAGGVALNCVSNEKVLRESGFDRIWVQPAAGDAGGAVGAAFYLWNTVLQNPRTYVMNNAYLGPGYSAESCAGDLDALDAKYMRLAEEELIRQVTTAIASGKVVGWFQDRMEFGPRALGARSILADPRDPDMKDKLNRAIKFREGFRPFAPSVMSEFAAEWFEIPEQYQRQFATPGESLESTPYDFMLLVAQVEEGKRRIPSVTHADGSARVQIVTQDANLLFHSLLKEFNRQTGVPMLINTSFNVRGEPIVCTPADAYRCFMRTNMDVLAVGPFLLEKTNQPEWHETVDWRKALPLD